MMPQFGASLTGDTRIIIYDRNMFIILVTAYISETTMTLKIVQ
jgi:hypothetical protein